MKSPVKTLFFILFILIGNPLSQNFNYSKSITLEELISKEYTNETQKCDLALVLSGGGARGIAQIGVIEILDSAGIKPDIIIGVSMGAVVGGLYAAGYTPKELDSIARSINWGELLSDIPERSIMLQTQKETESKYFLTIRFKAGKLLIPSGYLAAQKLLNKLSELTAAATIRSKKNFDKLPIRFRSVITDLTTGEAIALRKGNLGEAIRASISVPILFMPYTIDSFYAVDGGLRMPVPVEVAKKLGCKRIIAVNTTAQLIPRNQLNTFNKVAEQTTTIMQQDLIASERLLADVWIEPDLRNHNSTDFTNIDSLIEWGKDAARKALPKIFETIKKHEFIKIDTIISTPEIPGLKNLLRGTITTKMLTEKLDSIFRTTAAESMFCSLRAGTLFVKFFGRRRKYHLIISGLEDLPGNVNDSNFIDNAEKPLPLNKIHEVINIILSKLINNGYLIAHLDSLKQKADTMFAFINPGTIDSVKFSGNAITLRWVLNSHIKLSKGDIFNKEAIKQSIMNLYSTGLFNWVSYDLTTSSDNKIILTIKLNEKPNIALRFGLRYDELRKGEVAFGVFDDNFIGTALKIGAELWGGERRQNLKLTLQADKIWKTMLGLRMSALFNRSKYDHFIKMEIAKTDWVESFGTVFSLGPQFRKLGKVVVELESRKVVVKTVGTDEKKDFLMHKLCAKSATDTYDKRQFPTSGKKVFMLLEMSQDILGGQTSFTKYFAHIESAYSAFWFTFLPWFTAGHIAGTPPFFERFRIGQTRMIWGFRGDELTGNDILAGGIDLRINLRKRFKRSYVILGGSANNIWSHTQPGKSIKTIWCGGIALGLETPLGPLLVGWGRSSLYRSHIFVRFGYDF